MLNERAKKLVAALPANFEAALIQTEVSRFYLLDFDAGDAGTVLLLPDKMVYIIDSRYIESAQKHVKNAEVVLEQDVYAQVAELLHSHHVKHLYAENAITVAQLDTLREKLQGVTVDASPVLSREIMALRQSKDPEEIRRMREAQRITDACFTHILPFIKVGVQEIDLALEMEFFMRRNGAKGLAFPTICVTDPNTSLPHGEPGQTCIQAGNFLTMDFGAKYMGYCADMTRTVAIGEPGEERRKLYELVLKAHNAGIAAAAPGKKGCEVDAVARKVIADAGYGGYFGHGLGHALGIEVHESPRFSPKCEDEIKAGMVMSVEPGCYLAGRFGLRIEDAVLITETGCQSLAASEKQLIIL